MHRFAIAASCSLLLFACGTLSSQRPAGEFGGNRAERVRIIMGTPALVSLEQGAIGHASVAFETMEELDRVLSTYKESSAVSQLNRSGKLFPAPPALHDLLKRSIAISSETEGHFDVTIGSLIEDHYGFQKLNDTEASKLKRPAPPPSLNLVSSKMIEISGDGIRFLRPGVKIDFGGIGKGYAVDSAVQALKIRGVQKGRIALGGDIRCLDVCTVEVTNPLEPEKTFARFRTKRPDTAVSTSGNYRRYLGDKKDNHLLNPMTGRPQQVFASVTLVSLGDNTRLDALTTAVSVMSLEQAKSFLESHPEIASLLVQTNGKKLVSPQFSDFAEDLVFLED